MEETTELSHKRSVPDEGAKEYSSKKEQLLQRHKYGEKSDTFGK